MQNFHSSIISMLETFSNKILPVATTMPPPSCIPNFVAQYIRWCRPVFIDFQQQNWLCRHRLKESKKLGTAVTWADPILANLGNASDGRQTSLGLVKAHVKDWRSMKETFKQLQLP